LVNLRAVKEKKYKQKGAALQDVLLEGIEKLKPGEGMPRQARERRIYNILHLRYEEGKGIAEITKELAISERHYYRVLKAAIEALGEVIFNRLGCRSPCLLRCLDIIPFGKELCSFPQALLR
jgi:DNA-directed RNA polymerase specialized sigma subunit